MSNENELLHYGVDPVYPAPDGAFVLVTAAVLTCGLCGEMIDGMGGPGPAMCKRCGDHFMAGHLRGCVVWDGPDDRTLTAAFSPPPEPAPEAAAVKPLAWSLESKPNDYCSYYHTFADTPFGRYQIEWKGWKDHPSFSIDLGDQSVSCWASDVAGARRIAQADYETRVRSALSPTSDRASVDAVDVLRELARNEKNDVDAKALRYAANRLNSFDALKAEAALSPRSS